MCLAIPGKIVELYQRDELPMAKVEFGGVRKEVCLAYTPEAELGEYVLVHVGFALSRIDEQEAQEIFSTLQQIAAAGESSLAGEPAEAEALAQAGEPAGEPTEAAAPAEPAKHAQAENRAATAKSAQSGPFAASQPPGTPGSKQDSAQ